MSGTGVPGRAVARRERGSTPGAPLAGIRRVKLFPTPGCSPCLRKRCDARIPLGASRPLKRHPKRPLGRHPAWSLSGMQPRGRPGSGQGRRVAAGQRRILRKNRCEMQLFPDDTCKRRIVLKSFRALRITVGRHVADIRNERAGEHRLADAVISPVTTLLRWVEWGPCATAYGVSAVGLIPPGEHRDAKWAVLEGPPIGKRIDAPSGCRSAGSHPLRIGSCKELIREPVWCRVDKVPWLRM